MQQTLEAVESQSPPPESNSVPPDKPGKVEPVQNSGEPTRGTVKKYQIQLNWSQQLPFPLTIQPEPKLLKLSQTLTDVWVDDLVLFTQTIAGHHQWNTGTTGLTKDRLLLLLEEMKKGLTSPRLLMLLEEMKKGLSSPRLLRLLEEMKRGLNNRRSLLSHQSGHQFPNLSPF